MNYIEFRAMHANAAKAAGEKLTKDDYATLWADYKVEEGIVVKSKPRAAKGPSCKTFMSAEDCAAPCAWRTYGPKSSKSPVCYSPRTLSQQTRASIKAKAAARAALRPARQPKVKSGYSIWGEDCKSYSTSKEDCEDPAGAGNFCAWREAKGKKPAACYRPGTSRAPAAFRSSMGFGTFQQSGGYSDPSGGYFAQAAPSAKSQMAQMKGGYYAQPAETRAQMKGGYWF